MKQSLIVLLITGGLLVCNSCKSRDKEKKHQDSNTPADSTGLTDRGWPRTVSNSEGDTLIYYQPQVDDWKDFTQLFARIAFSLRPKAGKEILGVASLTAGTMVDKDAHTVYFKDVAVNEVRFPGLDDAQKTQMTALFTQLIPKNGNPISVDRLMADVEQTHSSAPAVSVKNDPPPIFYSQQPAILLIVEGKPVYAPIENIELQYVVNTNWDLFFEKASNSYYLLAGEAWLTAKDLNGPWTATRKLPADMSKLPTGQNFDDVIKMIPAKAADVTPKVYFSSVPAELILVNGAPVFKKIPDTKLMYVDNTENDLFADEANGKYYVLLSGRWFESNQLTSSWQYAGNDLPADFAKIPENSPRSNVLTSVPGTEEANDAVMLAQIPTTAVVNKADAEKKVKVNYDGDPKFQPIENTSMQYATNTQDKVIKVGDLYYLCFQGVWFMSTTPTGPWKTADSVPSEIYTIPPSSPVYNVTYVTQTNATPTTVQSNTTAGYFGMFVLGMAVGAVITYGTGYYHPPYVYWGPAVPYPIYRPWPATYGGGVVYNPWTGGYAAGRAAYGPYGAVGTSAWYNPATGRYGRSASAQSWYGGRTVAQAYNPWTGGYAATSQAHNAYSQWGSSVATRGNQWVQTGHISTAGGTAVGYRTSGGQSGVITHGVHGGTSVHTNNGGLYAGRDGNVYRKNDNGSWQHYNNNNGGWTQAGTLGSTQHQPATASTHNNRPGEATTTNRQPAKPLSGATQKTGTAQRPSSPPSNLGGATQHTTPTRPAGGFQNTSQEHTIQGLNHSATARERGQVKTERFQNRPAAGGRLRR